MRPNLEPSRALAQAWLKAGCPEKMIVHVATETIYLLDGKQVHADEFHARSPKRRPIRMTGTPICLDEDR